MNNFSAYFLVNERNTVDYVQFRKKITGFFVLFFYIFKLIESKLNVAP